MLRRPSHPAGHSSLEQYASLTSAWRRRHRREFLVLAAALALAALALNLWAVLVNGGPNWGAGFVTGVAAALYWRERSSPPGWVEQWQQGAWGERRTADSLQPLEMEGWHLLHDLRASKGTNLDHVAIGPGGVFLIDTKSVDGTVTLEGTKATVTRPDSDLLYRHDFGPHMKGQAYDVHARLRATARASQWVTPVVVLWGDFPARATGGRDAAFVGGAQIADWLRSQPPVLSADRAEHLARALRDAVPS